MDYSNNAFFRDDDPDKNMYLIQQAWVSFDYPQTLGVKLASGRFFSRDYGTDSTAVLINEAAGLLRFKVLDGKFCRQGIHQSACLFPCNGIGPDYRVRGSELPDNKGDRL